MTGKSDATDGKAFYEKAVALHMQGRVGEAEQAYEAVLRRLPNHAEGLHGLGILCLQGGRIEEAVAYLHKAVEVGGSTVVRNDLGVALCAAGQFAEAVDVYRDVVAKDPLAVSSLFNLGQTLNQLHGYEEAVDVLQKAVRLAPNDGRMHDQLAIAFAGCRRVDEAQTHFERAVALAPTRSDFFCDWGAALLKFGRPQQAADCYRRALALTPDSPAVLCGFGETLGRLNRHTEAIACFRQAIALSPDFALAYYNCGTALAYLGRLAEAKDAFTRAAALAPDDPAFHSALIGLEKIDRNDAHLKVVETMAADADRLDARDGMELQFTLTKAYDDVGDYGRAFEALRRGNAAKRRLDPYDVQQDLDRFHAIADAFTAEELTTHSGKGDPSDVPVFVVGMPRSGTSLVEQILASHPALFGAGEQGFLPDLINAGMAGPDFPAAVGALDAEAWNAIGATYVQRLRALAPTAARITDKLPLNFQLIGLICLALPRARIIHVMRDPMDTCFSCYFTLFANGLGFTDDLVDLGRYYRGYLALMDHWRTVLPPVAMLEVHYEALVANFEAEARRMVEYCGLAWDDRCLKFYETVRPVETASALQVRRPLYRTSVGRAAHYTPWLEPLRQALAGEG